jgi:hypothetical protein
MIISKERKVPLFEAQDIAAMELTGKNFHELNLHANGEKRRDREDRKELFQEVVAYLKQEFDRKWSEEDGPEPIDYQLGSPISKLEDAEKFSISAYDSRGGREFSVHIFPSRPSDEWSPDVSKDQFDMLQAHQKKTHDLGLFVGIIPSYRQFAMGKPIWQWMLQAAISHAKNHFRKQMDVVNLCGCLYAQGITDVFDSPKDKEYAITERGIVVGSKRRFIGTVPQIIDRRSEGHGYFRDAMAWAEDD